MSNLRIVYDNAANRATLAASSTAGSLSVNNMLTEIKSEVWRSLSPLETITVTWPEAEMVGVVAFPFCSLSAASQIRVRAYTYALDDTPVLDTGWQLPCPGSPFDTFGWGFQPLGVNSYFYGGAAYGVVWFDTVTVQKLVIDIDDSHNPLGYIEASRLVVGTYWTPINNADYGAQVSVADTSKHERSDAGDLRTDRGSVHKTISFDLSMMDAVDRNNLWSIIRGNGMYKPLFCSLVPETDDSSDEQIYQIYGKLSRQASISYKFINQYSSQLELEEV